MVNDLIEIQQQKRKGLTLIGSQLYKKGLTLYEINLSTKAIKIAEYSENYWNPIEKKGTRKLNVNANCVYRQFLNMKNAQKFASKI